MRDAGRSPEEVFRQVLADGGDGVVGIRTVRRVFDLDLAQAKEVMVRAQGWANSLGEYQERIAEWLLEGTNPAEPRPPNETSS
jgi:hypothetical protein